MDSTGTQPVIAVVPEAQSLPAITQQQRWIELGLVLLIAIVPAIYSAIIQLLYPRTGPPILPNLRTISGFLHQASVILLLIYLLSRRGASLKNIGLDWSWSETVVGFGLAMAALMLTAILALFVYWFGPHDFAPEMRSPRVIFAGISPWLLLLYSMSSSFFEETVVRGFLTTELIGLAAPVWLATLTSVLLQTSYHLYYGFGGALIVAGSFIVFGLYFASSRRLLPVILGHLFVDLVAVWMNHFR